MLDGFEQSALDRLATEMRACRICRDAPLGPPLQHEPRPIFRVSPTARICIASQAPGIRAHTSGKPFSDPSGVRLRNWMSVTEDEFYDDRRVAIIPMGFCFPGHDAQRGDLPPRKECALAWRTKIFAAAPQFQVTLLIGMYALRWHLPPGALKADMTETVRNWRALGDEANKTRIFPLPHPSWRNNGWLKRAPWFEAELLPDLRASIKEALSI